MKTTAPKEQVLAEYQASEKTTSEIARDYHISMATITVWAKKAGLRLRRRGRRRVNKTPRAISSFWNSRTHLHTRQSAEGLASAGKGHGGSSSAGSPSCAR
jgi:hypothetical protein